MAFKKHSKKHFTCASADILFSYVCGGCGRRIEAEKPVREVYEIRKFAGRKTSYELTEDEAARCRREAEKLVEYDLGRCRKRLARHDYTFLGEDVVCPECGAKQRWSYSRTRGIAETVSGPILMAAGIWLFLSFNSLGFGEGDMYMIGGIAAAFVGLALAYSGIKRLAGAAKTAKQPEGKPEVTIPESAATEG